jgi:hypothetical protein
MSAARGRGRAWPAFSPLGLLLGAGMIASSFTVFGPAPPGDPLEVGARMIARAGHPCRQLTSAERLPDGVIHVICVDSDEYHLLAVNGFPLALSCSIARHTGILQC